MRLVAYDPFVSPDRAAPTRCAARRLHERARRDLRFPDRPRDQDARHDRPRRRRGAEARQARAAPRQRGPGRHRRRGRPGRGAARRPVGRRRDRHVRAGADHRVAALRARQRRGHAPPRCVDVGGAGQGGGDHRRAGGARAAGRLRAVRGQRRRVGGLRSRSPVPPARRAHRPAVLGTRRRCSRGARGLLRG